MTEPLDELGKRIARVDERIVDLAAKADIADHKVNTLVGAVENLQKKAEGAEAKSSKPTIDEITQLQFDYAWKWFDHHSRQRITMFNYFVVFVGIVATALGVVFKEASTCPNCGTVGLPAICIAGIFIALIFLGFDVRNKRLVSYGQATLIWIEKNIIYKDVSSEIVEGRWGRLNLGILAHDHQVKFKTAPLKCLVRHSVLIPVTICVCIVAFGVVALFASHLVEIAATGAKTKVEISTPSASAPAPAQNQTSPAAAPQTPPQ